MTKLKGFKHICFNRGLTTLKEFSAVHMISPWQPSMFEVPGLNIRDQHDWSIL